MRVALLAQGFPPEIGGVQRYNARYAAGLAGRGHELTVVALRGAAGPDGDVPYEVVPVPHDRLRGEEVRKLVEVVADRTPDVCLISRASRRLGPVARGLARCVPVAMVFHGLRDRHCRRGAVRRWLARRRYAVRSAAGVIANSRDTRGRLVDLGVEPERISVVFPGVDLEAFEPCPEAGRRVKEALGLGDRPVILSVARLVRGKGQDRVIEVLPALRERVPGVVYLVVGDGPRRAELEEWTRERGVDGAVRFEGWVPPDAVAAWYGACDVLVQVTSNPKRGDSSGESFGLCLAEASACARPVVASRRAGAPEVVRDGETGCLVEPGDREELEEVLVGLLRNPARRRSLGEAGRRWVRRFRWSRGTDRLEEALRAAIRGAA